MSRRALGRSAPGGVQARTPRDRQTRRSKSTHWSASTSPRRWVRGRLTPRRSRASRTGAPEGPRESSTQGSRRRHQPRTAGRAPRAVFARYGWTRAVFVFGSIDFAAGRGEPCSIGGGRRPDGGGPAVGGGTGPRGRSGGRLPTVGTPPRSVAVGLEIAADVIHEAPPSCRPPSPGAAKSRWRGASLADMIEHAVGALGAMRSASMPRGRMLTRATAR